MTWHETQCYYHLKLFFALILILFSFIIDDLDSTFLRLKKRKKIPELKGMCLRVYMCESESVYVCARVCAFQILSPPFNTEYLIVFLIFPFAFSVYLRHRFGSMLAAVAVTAGVSGKVSKAHSPIFSAILIKSNNSFSSVQFFCDLNCIELNCFLTEWKQSGTRCCSYCWATGDHYTVYFTVYSTVYFTVLSITAIIFECSSFVWRQHFLEIIWKNLQTFHYHFFFFLLSHMNHHTLWNPTNTPFFYDVIHDNKYFNHLTGCSRREEKNSSRKIWHHNSRDGSWETSSYCGRKGAIKDFICFLLIHSSIFYWCPTYCSH